MKHNKYYEIQEWISPQHAIGEIGYFHTLVDARGMMNEPYELFEKLSAQDRVVRIVRVTEEIVHETDGAARHRTLP